MHFVIVWQDDPEIRPIFKPLMDRGAGRRVLAGAGGNVRLCRMVSRGTLKGEWYDKLAIYGAIYSTALHALKNPEGPAELSVMFVFHQTSRAAVRAIMGALTLLATNDLDKLAALYGKNLAVSPVTILSCESGTDLSMPKPVLAVIQPWVDQATNMREACFAAFTIRKVTGGGEYVPYVTTFSTGNAETGGITLDPWGGPRFVSLNGHFNADGTWDYNDVNGQPDKAVTPVGGTVYSDPPPNTLPPIAPTQVPPGQPLPPLLPQF